MDLAFDTLQIETRAGRRTAVVITPMESATVSAQTPIPGGSTPMSEMDARILAGARANAAPDATVCIFRTEAPFDAVRYRFDPAMSEDQAVDTALAMLDGQMEIYRSLLRSGLCLFLHTDLGPLEVHGFRGAVDRRTAQLEPLTGREGLPGKRAQLDLWMLRNLIFFFSLGFDKLIAEILPDKLSLMEKRMERIHRLAHEVEAASG